MALPSSRRMIWTESTFSVDALSSSHSVFDAQVLLTCRLLLLPSPARLQVLFVREPHPHPHAEEASRPLAIDVQGARLA